MATELLLKRERSALVPIDRASEEALTGIPASQTVKATIVRPRNVEHLRKFMALLSAIYPHQETYPTFDLFRSAVHCALGYGDMVKLSDDRSMMVARSISFAKMDQAGFEEFYERAVRLIMEKILPGVDRDDLNRQVDDIIEGRTSSGGLG